MKKPRINNKKIIYYFYLPLDFCARKIEGGSLGRWTPLIVLKEASFGQCFRQTTVFLVTF